jgi:hypothetical protein
LATPDAASDGDTLLATPGASEPNKSPDIIFSIAVTFGLLSVSIIAAGLCGFFLYSCYM